MSDYNFLIESRLSPEQHRVLSAVSHIAAEQGLNLYLVGGAVRDLTYGQQVVRDLDLALEGNPERILRYLESGMPPRGARDPQEISTTIAVPPALEYQRFDSRLNSADLRFAGDVRAEIAMCRQEIYARPGQRPEIRPATIFDDLKRRDFSANAMAVSLHRNSRGLLLDPTNGAADIERHEFRVLHSRSFLEDPLRIYRLLRLGARLGFKPEERTQTYLGSALEQRWWENLDEEQQGRELRAILQEENPGRIFKMLTEQKLLAGLDKKVASSRIPYDRFAKIRSVCQSVPGADPFLLNFHCLAEKLPASQKSRLAEKVVVEPKAIKMVLGFERDAKRLAQVLGSAKAKLPSQIYALLSGQPITLLLYSLTSSPRAVVQTRIKNYLFKYSQVRARLPRAELQALGVKPGKEFEKIIERIFAEQLDGKIKTPQQLGKRMRELAGIKEPPPKPPAKPQSAKAGKKGAVQGSGETARRGKKAKEAAPVEAQSAKPASHGRETEKSETSASPIEKAKPAKTPSGAKSKKKKRVA